MIAQILDRYTLSRSTDHMSKNAHGPLAVLCFILWVNEKEGLVTGGRESGWLSILIDRLSHTTTSLHVLSQNTHRHKMTNREFFLKVHLMI